MEIVTVMGLMQRYCKLKKCFGMFITGWDLPEYKQLYWSWEEVWKAAPYLDDRKIENEDKKNEIIQVYSDGTGIMLFKTQKEMEKYYEMTVGDEGPTKLNKYNGPARVYAITCNPKGQLEMENT